VETVNKVLESRDSRYLRSEKMRGL